MNKIPDQSIRKARNEGTTENSHIEHWHIPWKAMIGNYKAFNVGTNITTAAKL